MDSIRICSGNIDQERYTLKKKTYKIIQISKNKFTDNGSVSITYILQRNDKLYLM